jgi:hypothetical protein
MSEQVEGMTLYTLTGVREYTDGDPVELRRDPQSGRLVFVAWTECHNNITRIDLFDLLEWLRLGPSDGRIEGGFTIPFAENAEHGRAYAQRKGWTVADEHVYVDDGISGAEFANRPGFLRLMNSLKTGSRSRPGFQVLIMSEESRLGREAIETAYALPAACACFFTWKTASARSILQPTRSCSP